MTGAEKGNGSDLEEAMAVEIGMSLLKARRVASEAVAEAERRAREFVMAPDVRLADVVSAVRGPVPITGVPNTEPPELDLKSLAAQVDEIEETLLSCHQRVLRLFDEAPSNGEEAPTNGDEAPTRGEEAPTKGDEAPYSKGPAHPVEECVVLADHEGAVADEANIVSPTAAFFRPATEPEAPHAPEPASRRDPVPRPVTAPSNGSGWNPRAWGPPDASSRVAAPDDEVAGELEAGSAGPPAARSEAVADGVGGLTSPPVEQSVSQSVTDSAPQPVEESVWESAPQPEEQPAPTLASSPVSVAGPASKAKEQAVPRQAAVWPLEEPAMGPAQPYANANEPGKSSSTLWLMNVIGFSVLLIVVVVVLMLANVL